MTSFPAGNNTSLFYVLPLSFAEVVLVVLARGRDLGKSTLYIACCDLKLFLSIAAVKVLMQAGHSICKDTCNFIWDGHGRWIDDKWHPYQDTPGGQLFNSSNSQISLLKIPNNALTHSDS